MEFFLIALLGALFSAFGTVVGFGGGVFMVPVLIIGFGVPIKFAIGSVMVALFPSALVSTYFNFKNGTVDFVSGILIEIPTMVGTVVGSYLTAVLPVHYIEIAFSIFIVVLGIYMFGKKSEHVHRYSRETFLYKMNRIGPRIIRRGSGRAYRISFIISLFAGIFAGMLAGFFGVGGGFMKVPIMVNLFNMPAQVAASTGLFMIVITSLTGSITHYFLGHVIFSRALPVVIGFFIGALIGNILNLKVKDKTIGHLIAIGLILAGAAVLIYGTFVKTP